ncbi:choline dehydrogenase [Favolaschia claudopus]|uniref:Choline dehydrogenase n=1 Tax=Favolaschia claudopus TaxID=2862362 RepID=A0AAW0AC09_9AGAR
MGRNLQSLLALVLLSVQILDSSALPTCSDTSTADYDFVVVGAGVGGGPVAARLAESGFSVLVVDAGHDAFNINTTIPFYWARAVDDPQLELNYTYDEYSPGAKFPRPNSWYPRARGVGGSTVHNAMINLIGVTKGDFNGLATMFNDSTWSFENMRNYFKRMERNLDFDKSNPDHGFSGWLSTRFSPASVLENPMFADAQLADIANTLASSGPPITPDDINSVANDGAIGVGTPSFTIDENLNRSSIRDHLIEVKRKSAGKLQFSLDTLVTKILLCEGKDGGLPTAYGVEMAPGAALAVASNFAGKQTLNTKTVTARYEVIVSAGVFQTPQLLMLSGIGDREQLSQHGIETVVHLPGVGTNLQDHDEVSNIWTLKQNHTLFNGCTLGSTPEQDPCLAYWIESGHQNLYSLGATSSVQFFQTSPDLPEPDIMIYWALGYFPGFFRGFPDQLANRHNILNAIVLRAHSVSQGVVQLTGNHPQDFLTIEKRHFEAPGSDVDFAAIRKTIQTARDIVRHPNITKHIEGQLWPEPDTEIDDHILQHVFGHHACCTASMGPDDDPNAVLDGNFNVRGVKNLRVVDISSWHRVPGWFVTTPTYMLAEKAADVIIAAAGGVEKA